MNYCNPFRQFHKFTDQYGRLCVRVPIANLPLSITLDSDDFEAMAADLVFRFENEPRPFPYNGAEYFCSAVVGAAFTRVTVSVAPFTIDSAGKRALWCITGVRLYRRPELGFGPIDGKAHESGSAPLQQERAQGEAT